LQVSGNLLELIRNLGDKHFVAKKGYVSQFYGIYVVDKYINFNYLPSRPEMTNNAIIRNHILIMIAHYCAINITHKKVNSMVAN